MLDLLGTVLTVASLCLFETISSIDNAIINAEVPGTMGERARRWFLIWGSDPRGCCGAGRPALAHRLGDDPAVAGAIRQRDRGRGGTAGRSK